MILDDDFIIKEEPVDLTHLAKLHPSYNQKELEQAHAQLMRYYELIWTFFTRMLKDGRLDRIFDASTKRSYDLDVKVEPISPNK